MSSAIRANWRAEEVAPGSGHSAVVACNICSVGYVATSEFGFDVVIVGQPVGRERNEFAQGIDFQKLYDWSPWKLFKPGGDKFLPIAPVNVDSAFLNRFHCLPPSEVLDG